MKRVSLIAMGGILVLSANLAQAAATKGATKKSLKRAPAAAKAVEKTVEPILDFQVYAETTSFEDLLKKREQIARQPAAFSPKARVIAVRRDLALSERDAERSGQDIILNEGTSAGLSEGMTLKVFRKVTVLDPYKNNKQTTLNVEYATIEVRHADGNVAIARLKEIEPIDKGFAIGTRAVMIGDFVGTP